MGIRPAHVLRSVWVSALAVTCLMLSPRSSAATSVGAVPLITVSASGAALVVVHYTTPGSFLSMEAFIQGASGLPFNSDVYIGILSPDGQSASWTGDAQAPVLTKGPPVPLLRNVTLSADTVVRLVVSSFPDTGSQGWYTLYGLVVLTGQDPGDPKQWFSSSFFPILVTLQ